MRNKTLLPAAWKLSGMENIGDDFSVNANHGIVEPMSEFELQMHFRAIKAVNLKKIVRIEVNISLLKFNWIVVCINTLKNNCLLLYPFIY